MTNTQRELRRPQPIDRQRFCVEAAQLTMKIPRRVVVHDSAVAKHSQPTHGGRDRHDLAAIVYYTGILTVLGSAFPIISFTEPAIDSPWTLQVKHYTIAKIRAEIPPLTDQDAK
jgi:hypothetical protein